MVVVADLFLKTRTALTADFSKDESMSREGAWSICVNFITTFLHGNTAGIVLVFPFPSIQGARSAWHLPRTAFALHL